MKTFSFLYSLLFFVLLSYSVMAQCPWIIKPAPGLLNSGDRAVVLTAVDDNVCWGKNNINSQFLRTTNGGNNWTVSTVTGAAGLECSGITAIDANTAWIAMNDPSGVTSGGIFKTTDGGSNWVKDSTAFQGSGGYPNVIHFFDADNGVCVGDPRGGYWEIYTTTNGGANWIRVPSGNIPAPLTGEVGIEHTIVNSAGNSYWFQTFSNRLYRTTDHGYTWTVTDSVTGGPSQLGFAFAFKDDLNGLAIDFYPQTNFSRTSDGGVTWESINPIPPGLSSLSLRFIVYVKGTNGSYVITSPSNIGGNQSVPGTAYSTDDGVTWTQNCNLSCGPAVFSSYNTGWCSSIEINDSIYKWVSDVLPVELVSFNSSVIGNNIQLSWQTGTEINNQGFEIYRNGNKISFVEGKGTTTEKQDYSFVDKNLQSGIYNYRLNQIDFDGTQEVVGELTVYLSLPEQFSLEQNYPNPFNPSTKIRYSVPISEFVTLKVYDVLGNEVATLVNEEKPAGSYDVEFNSHSGLSGIRELSSGIYFYTLQAGRYTQTKKLILMK